MFRDYKTTPRLGPRISLRLMLIVNLIATVMLFATFAMYVFAERINKLKEEQLASSEIIISCHQDDVPELYDTAPQARNIGYY